MNLSEPFIRRPVATTLVMAALAFVGITAYPFLPVAPLPQVDFPTIQVTATFQGASAETMASSVAAPLERQFAQIPGVTQLTSLSALGATTIVIQFDLNRNIDSAGQDVQAAITVAGKTLPQSMTTPPSYKKVNPADSPILLLSARSDTMPLTEVDDYGDLFLAQQISQVPGVALVTIFGDKTPSIRIQVDPAKLASSGVTLQDIRGTLVNATANAAKGTLNTDKISFTIAANEQNRFLVSAAPGWRMSFAAFAVIGVKELYRGSAFRSWRMIGRAGARRATSLKPTRANVEAVPTKIFDELFDALVSIGYASSADVLARFSVFTAAAIS